MPIQWPNTTPLPDEIVDRHLPDLSGAATKVILYITRHTFGYRDRTMDNISLTQFCDGIWTTDKHSGARRRIDRGTGLSRTSVIKALRELERRGLVRRASGGAWPNGETKADLWGLDMAPTVETTLEERGLLQARAAGGGPETERGGSTKTVPGGSTETVPGRSTKTTAPGTETVLPLVQKLDPQETRVNKQVAINKPTLSAPGAGAAGAPPGAATATPRARAQAPLDRLRESQPGWVAASMEQVRTGLRWDRLAPALELELRRLIQDGALPLGDLTAGERDNWWAFAFSTDFLARNASRLTEYMLDDFNVWLSKGTHVRAKTNARPAGQGAPVSPHGQAHVPRYDPDRDGTAQALEPADFVLDA